MVDYQFMSRNVRGFMSLFHANKPVVCKVHGFCVAGGTDLALCSDLLVIADDAKIGYPPARVWGAPTTALWAFRIGPEKAKRLLFTGDCLSGSEAVAWGLACESAPADQLDERFEALLARIALVPVNQLVLSKLLVNQSLAGPVQGSQVLGTLLDGVTRHTAEGYAFQQRAAEVGFRQAVAERDGPRAVRRPRSEHLQGPPAGIASADPMEPLIDQLVRTSFPHPRRRGTGSPSRPPARTGPSGCSRASRSWSGSSARCCCRTTSAATRTTRSRRRSSASTGRRWAIGSSSSGR
jgi:hypothetical protein